MKTIHLKQSVIQNLLFYSQKCHPKESILLLRGKTKKNEIVINDIIIPPLATYGQGFSTFPLHTLPIDFSMLGVAHSHPSGIRTPSTHDLNQFYGRIMVIISFPYLSKRDITVFDREGKELKFTVIEDHL